MQQWIGLTIFAAFLQAVRTAAQKRLAERMSTWAATYVRALIGLPVMLAWLALLLGWTGAPLPSANAGFLALCFVTAVTQNIGTAALLALFRLKSFAAAGQLAKSDVILTALLGLPLGQWITAAGWLAIGLAGAGVVLISSAREVGGGTTAGERVSGEVAAGSCAGPASAASVRADEDAPAATLGWREMARAPAVRLGLLIGLMFAICNLALREASLALGEGDVLVRAALTVTVSTLMQVVLLGLWLGARETGTLAAIRRSLPLSLFVGVTSAIGSICWFAAFASTNAAYVRAVGQIEVAFSILLSLAYFRERLSPREWVGIALTVAGVLVLRVMG